GNLVSGVSSQLPGLVDKIRTMSRTRRLALISLAATGAAAALLVGAGGAAQAATGATVRTGGIALNIRTAPSLTGKILATMRNGSAVAIVCQQNGQNIAGLVRTTAAWDMLADGRWVSDAYVQRPGPAPAACATAA